MKRNSVGTVALVIVVIAASIVAWRVHGHLATSSGRKQTPTHAGSVSAAASGRKHTSTQVAIVSAVYDKLNTSGDYPPIVFSRNGNLYAVSLNGTDPVLLTNTGRNSDAYYLPKEGKLLFIKEIHTVKALEGGDVECIDFRTGRESVLLPASAFNPAWAKGYPGSGFVSPALAPKTHKLVVLEQNNVTGGGPVLTASSAGKGLALIPGYAWSYVLDPNGTGMAFANGPGGPAATSIYDLVWGHRPVRLLPNNWNGLRIGSLAWRPDGRSIAFFGHTGWKVGIPKNGLKNGIYMVTTTGRVRRVCLLSGTYAYGLHWLSNDRLAFIDTSTSYEAKSGVFNFCVVNVDDGKPELLARVKDPNILGRSDWPEWSWNPANTAFVFQKERNGSLWVKYLSRANEEKLPGTAGADNLNLTWRKGAYASFQ